MGAGAGGRRHGLGGVHAEHGRERLHAGGSGNAPGIAGSSIIRETWAADNLSRAARRSQSTWTSRRWSTSCSGRRDVAAPCEDRAQFRTQPLGHRRIGFAIRYVAAHVKQSRRRRDRAMLVRGEDRWNYFDQEEGATANSCPRISNARRESWGGRPAPSRPGPPGPCEQTRPDMDAQCASPIFVVSR